MHSLRTECNLSDRQIKNLICGYNTDYNEIDVFLAIDIYNSYKNTNLSPEERVKMTRKIFIYDEEHAITIKGIRSINNCKQLESFSYNLQYFVIQLHIFVYGF